jgi:NAD(P)-dependent dehydrogenase (short-subunit alcohol dehydrogenase family)
MSNRTALVTGGTAGIGRATAQGLVRRGFEVVIVGHNRERGERVAREIQEQPGAGRVTFEAADLTSLDEVRALGERLAGQLPQLNALVHNFGGMYADRRVTTDGHEATFAGNVLTPLLLSTLLLPALRAGPPSRVVFVNSDAHKFAVANLDDLRAERFYRGFDIYARSKLLQLLVARHLSSQLPDGVSALMVNPGGAWTEQIAAMKPRMTPPMMRLMWPIVRIVQKRRTPQQAAEVVIRAATDPELQGRNGVWIDQNNQLGEPSEKARDDALAARVYGRAARMMDGGIPADADPAQPAKPSGQRVRP